MKHKKEWEEYCKFMNANLEKKRNYHESPHIIIRKSFHLIYDNSIILKNPVLSEDTSFYRKIYYDVDRVGKNVKILSKNKNYKTVKLDEIKGKKIFLLVNLKYVRELPGLIYFDELGKRIEKAAL